MFAIQNPEHVSAIDQFKALVKSGDYVPASALVPVEELSIHPWILLGWGCNEDKFPEGLRKVKSAWVKRIEVAGIPSFGKEHPEGKGYYHPRYALYQPQLLDELVQIYERVVLAARGKNVHIFAVSDTKPVTADPKTVLNVPDDDWLGWRIMKENPEDIVRGFSHLRIDARYKLRAYQRKDPMGANGVVWAIPSNRELPDPVDCNILDNGWNIPKPSFALDDFMNPRRQESYILPTSGLSGS